MQTTEQNARQIREGAERLAAGLRIIVVAAILLALSQAIPALANLRGDQAQAAEAQETLWENAGK